MVTAYLPLRLGRVMATPAAKEAIDENALPASYFLTRHASGDWGDVCDDDKEANDASLLDGSRLLSAYKTSKGVRLWIITEAVDDDGVRASTTILLPDEY